MSSSADSRLEKRLNGWNVIKNITEVNKFVLTECDVLNDYFRFFVILCRVARTVERARQLMLDNGLDDNISMKKNEHDLCLLVFKSTGLNATFIYWLVMFFTWSALYIIPCNHHWSRANLILKTLDGRTITNVRLPKVGLQIKFSNLNEILDCSAIISCCLCRRVVRHSRRERNSINSYPSRIAELISGWVE